MKTNQNIFTSLAATNNIRIQCNPKFIIKRKAKFTNFFIENCAFRMSTSHVHMPYSHGTKSEILTVRLILLLLAKLLDF